LSEALAAIETGYPEVDRRHRSTSETLSSPHSERGGTVFILD
jgi:hypothetical protein